MTPARRFGLFDQLVLLMPLAAGIVVTQSMVRNELATYLVRQHLDWIDTALDWIPVVFFGFLPRYALLAMPALLIMRLLSAKSASIPLLWPFWPNRA